MSAVIASPRHVDIDITSKCNLRCRYCYYFNDPDHVYEDLPADEWLKFFEECGNLKVMEINLAGGEPFARDDLTVILDGIIRNRMRFALLSNGGLITGEMADYLSRSGRCNYIQISLDGSTADVHDSCRGKGAFEGALRGIRILQAHHVPVAIRLTVNRMNVHHLEEAAHFILEELGLPSFGTNSAGYLGSCRANSDDVQLTTKERELAMKKLMELCDRYPDRIQSTAGPLADVRFWKRMIDARDKNLPAYAGTLCGCGCTCTSLAVLSNGKIVPCGLLPHLECGWINRDSLQRVWKNSPHLIALRQRGSISLNAFDMCKDCEFQPYCTGNCPSMAYALLNKVNHPSPDACLKLYLADGGTIP